MSNGFRMSGLIRDKISSAEYRGGRGAATAGGICGDAKDDTQSRAFRIASNLCARVSLRAEPDVWDVLIGSHLIREACYRSMDLSPSQLLGSNNFARRHLHQRRAAQEDLCLFLYEYRVVGQSRVVCTAGGRGSEYNCAGKLTQLATNSQIAKKLASLVKYSKLLWKEDAGGLDQCDYR